MMEAIKRIEKKPTSDEYLLSKANTRIVVYSELKKYRSIDEILKSDTAIILYEKTKGNIGHWVCLTRRGATLEYFDSYGRPPDPWKYLKGNQPVLSRLLYDSPYNLEYNEHNYQKTGLATCGRHCIIRVLLKDESLENYNLVMDCYDDTDELVTILSLAI